MAESQLSLFPMAPDLPPDMRYKREVISRTEESALIDFIVTLPLEPFEFTGRFHGKRRVTSFGWRYDFNAHRLSEAAPIPNELMPVLRQAAAAFGVAPEMLRQVLVTEYAAGAGIGWHKDRPIFEHVIGVSLASACRFRLRRRVGDGWLRTSFEAEPRSAYVMTGASRHDWEHSIPPVDTLRYSLTFRSLAEQHKMRALPEDERSHGVAR